MTNDLAIRFTEASAHFLWQGTAIALVAWVLTRLLAGKPRGRHTVFLLALAALAICLPANLVRFETEIETAAAPARISEIPTIPDRTLDVPGSAAAEPAIPASIPPEPVENPSDGWSKFAPWFALVYLIGLSLMISRLGLAIAQSRRLRRSAETVREAAWTRTLAELRRRFQLRTSPALKWSREVAAPVVFGLIKPVILLPISLSLQLSRQQAEIVLAHELAHLRRLDPWVVVLQRLVETLFFFHPAVWWVSRQLERAREEACDDLVVEKGADPADYAETLVRCSELRLAEASGLQLAATGGPLRSRILRLLGSNSASGVRPGRAGWLVVGLIAAGVAIASVFSAAEDEREDGLTLTRAQNREAERLIELLPNRNETLVDQLIELGPGVAPKMIPLLKTGRTDWAGLKVLQHFAKDPAVQQLLVDAIREGSSNTRHCAIVALADSENPKHAEFVGQYLEDSSIAAITTLSKLGGAVAVRQLLKGFEVVPTDKWFILVQAIGDLGDPVAVSELKRRLAEVELPPNDAFPRATAPAFARAIAKLESGGDGDTENVSWGQGQEFRYPYDGPGTPKTFSVTTPRDHFVRLPDVDPETAEGRAAIFKKLRDSTEGPGFTIDGEQLILFNGLIAAPLWPEGKPFPESLFEYLGRTPQREVVEHVRGWQNRLKAGPVAGSRMMQIPADDLVAALSPEGQIIILSLRKTSDKFVYDVGMHLLNPALQLIPSRPAEEAGKIEFGQRWGLPLNDYRAERRDSAWRLDIGQMTKLTAERFSDPNGVPMIGLRLEGDDWALVSPGAERFLMVEAEGVWEDAELAAAALKQAAREGIPRVADHRFADEGGAKVHEFSSHQLDRSFAFALKMPEGAAVAGVIQTHRFQLDDEPPTVRFLHKFLPNAVARAVFEGAQPAAAGQSKRQRFEPVEGLEKETSWSVIPNPTMAPDKPWMLFSHISLGGVAPLTLPDAEAEIFRIKMVAGNDDAISLRVFGGKLEEPVELTVERDEEVVVEIEGERFKFYHPSTQVGGDDADTSPTALLIVTPEES